MDLKDILYNNRNDIGIKNDISYGELLKLENIIKNYYNNDNDNKDINKLINISMKMKDLLEKCRNNKLPLKLGKQIDNLFKELEYL